MFADLCDITIQEQLMAECPEVLRIASSFYDHAVGTNSNYISPVENHRIEARADLGFVVVRNLFVPEFITGIIDFTEQKEFYKYLTDRDCYRYFYCESYRNDISELDFFGSIIESFNSEIDGVEMFINKYEKSLSRQGIGEPHVDDNAASPVVLLGYGAGFIEIANKIVSSQDSCPTQVDLGRFSRDSVQQKTIKLNYGGGDILVFDGTRRLHRGAVNLDNNPDVVRYSLVGYPVKNSN